MFTNAELAMIEISLINRLAFLRDFDVPLKEEKIQRCEALIEKVRHMSGDSE